MESANAEVMQDQRFLTPKPLWYIHTYIYSYIWYVYLYIYIYIYVHDITYDLTPESYFLSGNGVSKCERSDAVPGFINPQTFIIYIYSYTYSMHRYDIIYCSTPKFYFFCAGNGVSERERSDAGPGVHLRAREGPAPTRKVDVRLPDKMNSNSHGARPVHQIISMMKWMRTSRLPIKNSLFWVGVQPEEGERVWERIHLRARKGPRERLLYWPPTGPSPLYHRDN